MSLSDWTIANPESAGLRSEPLRDLVEWLDGLGQANIHSVLVVRHGRLLPTALPTTAQWSNNRWGRRSIVDADAERLSHERTARRRGPLYWIGGDEFFPQT
jgi:hypothetical protein